MKKVLRLGIEFVKRTVIICRRILVFERQISHDELASFFTVIKENQAHLALMRIGKIGDGGYLVPENLGEIDACFSPGVAESAHFEDALATLGIPSYLTDASVKMAPAVSPLMSFESKHLDTFDSKSTQRLDSWINKYMPLSDRLLLQMDIEGDEYKVLLDVLPETLKRFKVVVIEFHELDRLLLRQNAAMIKHVFLKILKNFFIVHIHPNNAEKPFMVGNFCIYPTLEFTFVRRDLITDRGSASVNTHTLDSPNLAGKKDIKLHDSWKNLH